MFIVVKKGKTTKARRTQRNTKTRRLPKTKAVAPRAVYIREYGKTVAKGIVPVPDAIEKWLVSTENDIRAEGLDSKA